MTDITHLNQLASQVVGHVSNAALWVPSSEVLCFSLPPLTAPRKKWDQMIPWQLEDELIQAPDQYHFVWHQATVEDEIQILAVPKTVMQNWLLLAKAGDHPPIQMAPDFLALPVQGNDWTAYIEGNYVTVRTGLASGFACDLPFFWQLLSRELQQNPEIRVWLWSDSQQELPGNLTESDRIDLQIRELKWDYLELPQEWNLLTAEYAVSKRTRQQIPKPLTTGLGIAAIIFCFFYLGFAAGVYRDNADKLEHAIASEFATRFDLSVTNPSTARAEAETILESRNITDRLMTHSQVGALLRADSVLSNCPSCDLRSIRLVNDTLELRFVNKPGLESQLSPLSENFELHWRNINQEPSDRYRVVSLLVKTEGSQI